MGNVIYYNLPTDAHQDTIICGYTLNNSGTRALREVFTCSGECTNIVCPGIEIAIGLSHMTSAIAIYRMDNFGFSLWTNRVWSFIGCTRCALVRGLSATTTSPENARMHVSLYTHTHYFFSFHSVSANSSIHNDRKLLLKYLILVFVFKPFKLGTCLPCIMIYNVFGKYVSVCLCAFLFSLSI